MLYYNIKLIIYSIILGTLTLIYSVRIKKGANYKDLYNIKNDYDKLYKNMKYNNIVLVPTKFRSLVELIHEHKTNRIHINTGLREYKNTNERKYKKNKYPNGDAKRKQKIPELTDNENIGTTNLNKYKKGTYDKEKEAKSYRSSRSLKCLEMQRKLYNNFYIKTEIYFENFSDKSNDKSYESANKNKTHNQLSSSNKVHDKYLDNLKSGCVGCMRVCALSSAFTGIVGNAAVAASATTLSDGSKTAVTWATFHPYGITICVIISVAIIVILLYVWLRKRRKNSWEHECKKRLCT